MPGMLPPVSAENVGTGCLTQAIGVNVTTLLRDLPELELVPEEPGAIIINY